MARPPASYAVDCVRVSCICVLGLFFATISHAQQYPFIEITPPGAPRACFTMLESSHGGLWLATCETGKEGFFYFDGSRFISPLEAPFPKVSVSGMAEDSEGGIWIGSSGGLYRFNGHKLEKLLDGIAMVGVTRVAPDVFLTFVAPPGRNVQDADLIRIVRTKEGWKAETLVTSIAQVQFHADGLGNVLYGCAGGYCEVKNDQVATWKPGSTLSITHHAAPTRRSYSSGGSMVWKDRFGCIWFRSTSDASYQCPGDSRPVTLPDNVVSVGSPQIIELKDGTIVMPDFGKVAIGRPGKFRVLTMRNGYPSAGQAVATKDGNVLLSSANGLFLMPTQTAVESWSQHDGLEGNTWSVLRMEGRTFAVAGDEIKVLNQDRSRWLPWARVRAATHLIVGPEKTMLVGSHTDGVVQINMSGRILRRSPPTDVAMLARTPGGHFWASGNGVFEIVVSGRGLQLQPAGLPGPQTGASDMSDMKVDENGDLWVCYAGGLVRKNVSGWHLISNRNGIEASECISFAIDRSGNTWYSYATFLSSLLIQNTRSDKPVFREFPNGDALGVAQSHFLNFDRRGRLWRGGADGVYVADTEHALLGDWLHLDRRDGLPAVDTNQKSFFEDADGSIWFGADSSVIHLFPPKDLVHPGYSPPIFISSFSSNGDPPQLAATVGAVANGSDIAAHIGLLQFDRRSALHVRYRLLPEQVSWQSAQGQDIRLGKVSWGRHILEVQGRLGSGPWSATAATSLTVSPPVWLSWRAVVIFVLAGALALVASHRWRRKRKDRARKVFPELGEWRLAALSPEVRRLEGTVLDSRFEVGRVLARGGFATVTEGVDLCQGRKPCAIKIFRQELVNKDWMARRFQQEVLALEQVHHPNVVGICGHGTTPGGAPFLVMEFIDGQTLREVLESGRLNRPHTASYLRQTARALEEIHAHGIFHRDLKPDNVMIRSAGRPGEEIVLIDFSIAIVKDADETLHGLSRAAGTMYYMAPEQAIGYADTSTDIHSLAKIVIEMLTGQRLSALLPQASMDLPARVRELLENESFGLSAAAIDLISGALEFDPCRRPQDAKAFASTVVRDLEATSECRNA